MDPPVIYLPPTLLRRIQPFSPPHSEPAEFSDNTRCFTTTLRDVHEYILVFSKGMFKRQNPTGQAATISKDEFLEYTKSVWNFPAESARKIGHPAPFPVELPRRLIQLYTFAGDVILDPFMGSGQVALAAIQTGRQYVGYEIDPNYVALSKARIRACLPLEQS